jgi:hypothetical protein
VGGVSVPVGNGASATGIAQLRERLLVEARRVATAQRKGMGDVIAMVSHGSFGFADLTKLTDGRRRQSGGGARGVGTDDGVIGVVAPRKGSNEMEVKEKARQVRLVTDGSCIGNPGPGGWACLLHCD